MRMFFVGFVYSATGGAYMNLKRIKSVIGVLKLFGGAAEKWMSDDVPAMAAALAYHAMLSLAPLLIVLLGTFSMLFGSDAVETEVVTQIEISVGERAASAVQNVIRDMEQSRSEALALGGSSLILLIIFSIGVFKQLIGSLNAIWGLDKDARRGFSGGVLRMIRRHFLAFLMLIGLGLWLYLLLLSKSIAVVPERFFLTSFPWLVDYMPRIPLFFSPVLYTLLFAILYTILPDARIKWSDVWFGAAVTAILFMITEKLIGLYLQRTIVTSLYGAAGSLIVVLLWIYWSANVFLFGAELTRAYAIRFGSRRPDSPAL